MTNATPARPRAASIAFSLAAVAFALTACSASPDPAVAAEEAASTVHEDIVAYVNQIEGKRVSALQGIRCDGIETDAFAEQISAEETPIDELTFTADCSYQKEAWQPLSDAGVENGYKFFYCTSHDLNVLDEFNAQVRAGETSFPKTSGIVSCVTYSPQILETPPCEDGFPNCPQWLENELARQKDYEARQTQVFPQA